MVNSRSGSRPSPSAWVRSFLGRLRLLAKKPDLVEHVLCRGSGLVDLNPQAGVFFLEAGEPGPGLCRRAGSGFKAFQLRLCGEGAFPESGHLFDEVPHHRLQLSEGCGISTFWVGHSALSPMMTGS